MKKSIISIILIIVGIISFSYVISTTKKEEISKTTEKQPEIEVVTAPKHDYPIDTIISVKNDLNEEYIKIFTTKDSIKETNTKEWKCVDYFDYKKWEKDALCISNSMKDKINIEYF